jgi:hypothetical protein
VTLSRRALNRALLARQMLLKREPLAPLEAMERLVAMQAQQLRPPFIGLWTRLEGFQSPMLDALLRERKVVRATLLRATLHMLSARDYLEFRHTMQPALTASMQSILKSRGAELDIDAVAAAAVRRFRGTPQTFQQLRDSLIGEFPGLDERAMGYLARTLIPLVMTPGANESAFTLAEEWLGRAVPAEERLDDLMLRYLAAFGPAAVADAQTWSGLGKLKPVFERLRRKLAVFQDEEGRELFDAPGAPLPPEDTPAPVRFMPGFDNVILGHADRSRIIADEHRPRVVTKNLQVLPVVLVDGFAAGTWSMEQTKTKAALEVALFGGVTARARKEMEAEAARLMDFLDLPPRREVKIG